MRFYHEPQQSRGVTWEQAFPEWHLVEETVRVDGRQVITLTPHEHTVDAVLEIAAHFRSSVDHAIGQLYPLVPSLFPVRVDGSDRVVPFSSIASSTASDVFKSSPRKAIRQVHRTLTQVNLASAVAGTQQWPSDEIAGPMAAGLFHLEPVDFYLVSQVGIAKASSARAHAYLAATADIADIDDYLDSIGDAAYESAIGSELRDRLAPLLEKRLPIDVVAAAETLPQLVWRLPMLDITVAEAIGYLHPGWTLRDGFFVEDHVSHSTEADTGDRALELIFSHPGVTSNDLGRTLGRSAEEINHILAARGQAFSRLQNSSVVDRPWTTYTWHRLGLRSGAEVTELLSSEGLTFGDLGLPEPGEGTRPYTPVDEALAPTTPESTDRIETTPEPVQGSRVPIADFTAVEGSEETLSPPEIAEPSSDSAPDTTPEDEGDNELPADADAEDAGGTADELDAAEAEAASTLPLASESLHDWEDALAPRLESATLAVEVDLTESALSRLLLVYGRRFQLSRARRTPTSRFISRFPASTLVALVGVASTEFENNTYWTHFFEAIGIEHTAPDENAMRSSVLQLLEKFGLDPLPGIAAHKRVERLAVHAGIPASSFGSLLDALMAYVALVDNREDRPFREWIEEPSHELLLHSLTAPTRAFIRHGGAKAGDYLAAIVDVVSAAAENPALDGAARAMSMHGRLPTLVRTALAAAFHAGDIGESVRATRKNSGAIPTLQLGDDSVLIRLPAPTSYVDKQWAVTLDADVRLVHPRKLDRDRGVDVLVDSPVRRAVVSHPSYNNPIEMRLFDSPAPLIAFSTTGEHLAATTRLPRGEIVALYPTSHEIAGEGTAAPLVRGQFPPPHGWAGWTMETWDLTETTSVRMVPTGPNGTAFDLGVGSRQVPELDFTDGEALELEGVTHRSLPVFGVARPWILLPALRASDAVGWTVRYRRSGSAEWTTQDTYHPEEQESRELFAGEPPTLGAFEVEVTGPESTRFRTELFLADGLSVTFDEDFRIPDGDEMTPISADIEIVDSEITAETDHLEFGPGTSHLDLRLRLGNSTQSVRIRPPRLEFRMTPVGAVPVWSDRRISRHPDEFRHATLAIRGVPAEVGVEVDVLDFREKNRQHYRFEGGRRSGTLLVKTDEFLHTTRTCQYGELWVRLRYPGGDSYAAPLVRFSSLGHNYTVDLDGEEIVVAGIATDEHVECHVWQLDRPWKEPLALPVSGGRAVLPLSLEYAGSLRVSVHVTDEWDPVEPERFPDQRSVRLDRRGHFISRGIGLLSQFLSGETPLPHFPAGLPEAWSALALLDRNLDEHDRGRFEAVAEVFLSHPREAARGLASAELSNEEKLALFIGSGLVFSPLWHEHDDERPYPEVVPEPWLDMLFSIADMPSAPLEMRMSMLDRVEEIGGASLRSCLVEGVDPEASRTVIDRPAVALSSDPAELRKILAHHKLVPGRLVDAAARYEGFLELFEHRDLISTELHKRLNEVSAEGGRAPFRAIRRYGRLRDLVNIRSEHLDGVDPAKDGWANATYISLCLAFYGRLVARDMLSPRLGEKGRKLRRTWSEFARLQPIETMIDIVLADALSAHESFSRRAKNPFLDYDPTTDAEKVGSILASLNTPEESSLIHE